MADPRFHDRAGPFSLAELAALTGAEARGRSPETLFTDVAAMETAGPSDVVFVENKRYLTALAKSSAGVCILRPELAESVPPRVALLLAREPHRAFSQVARAFYPRPASVGAVAPSAQVDPSATVDPSVDIGPGAVIGPGAEIGAGSVIGPLTVIDRGVVLGADCRIGASVTISHAIVGRRVVVYPGARIGQDGFGFVAGAGGHLKVPQLGRVIIHDDVDIGANTTIERGTIDDTVIGPGCLIDNLVQIGHNVRLGRGCILVGQVGISGSTVVGDFVMVGGQAGMTGHLSIGDGARIAAQTGVMRDVPSGTTVCGSPAVPIAEFFRQTSLLQRLAKKKDA